MKSTVAEITQTGTAIVKNYSKETIIEVAKNNTYDTIYAIVKHDYPNRFDDSDISHITWFIMGYCGLD